jgi:8-amino-7-oxononanoate synthase
MKKPTANAGLTSLPKRDTAQSASSKHSGKGAPGAGAGRISAGPAPSGVAAGGNGDPSGQAKESAVLSVPSDRETSSRNTTAEAGPREKTLLKKIYSYASSQEVRAIGLYPYFRCIQSCQNPEVLIGGRTLIMMGSNNYLGLVSEPRVIEAARAAAQRYGTGCAGSRLLNGTLDIHEELERRLAAFVMKESALLYSTGYQANLGAVATLAGRNDDVVLDKRNHASIVDAVTLSRARSHRFRHNDMEHLEYVLSNVNSEGGVLVVVDGVFSMEGDVAKLPQIVGLCRRTGAVLMVDDAHGLGVLGKGGRGTCHHFGLTDQVEVIMGTFSKSLASIGGFIASDRQTIEYLRHHSRAMIFSASMPPASVASVLKALDLIETEPERIDRLWKNTEFMRKGLISAGFDVGQSTTPIIPVRVGEDMLSFKMCMMLHEEGVFVNPVPGLSVEPGNALIRISLMATHEQRHMEFALEKIEKVGRALGVLGSA